MRMLHDATSAERSVLGAFPFTANATVLHTDRRLLPARPRAWTAWNYRVTRQPADRPTVTYYMNHLQTIPSAQHYCVSLNQSAAIDPSSVIYSTEYEHPLYTAAGHAAQRRHHEISGVNRTHFCGAYWRWGFHEDGVVSAVQVAQRFGVGSL
jgi:predicted NAD/FAD-binding protein